MRLPVHAFVPSGASVPARCFMKQFALALALLTFTAARAQQPAPAPTQQPIVLQRGHMQVQAHSAANRPDRAPVYPGGEQALGLFFLEHLKYPDAARAKRN